MSSPSSRRVSTKRRQTSRPATLMTMILSSSFSRSQFWSWSSSLFDRFLRMRRIIAPPFVSVLLSLLLSASDAVWLDVPFIKQQPEGCGAASIAMVMQYWARQSGRSPDADPTTIQRALYSRDARGIYASAMEKYLQQNGFQTFVLAGSWSDLEH